MYFGRKEKAKAVGVRAGVGIIVGWFKELDADVDEGRKLIAKVPEKRTTDTERAIGRMALRGFG